MTAPDHIHHYIHYIPIETIHGPALLWAREGDTVLVSYRRGNCTDEAMRNRYHGEIWYVMIPANDVTGESIND